MGYKFNEIMEVIEKGIRIRDERATSVRNQKWDVVYFTLEKMKSSVNKLFITKEADNKLFIAKEPEKKHFLPIKPDNRIC